MSSRTLKAISGRLSVTAVLVWGALLLLAPAAPAQSAPLTFYVSSHPSSSPRAHDGGLSGRATSPCTSRSAPCATIAQAITEEALFSHDTTRDAVISLSRGIYSNPADTMFRDLDASNDGVTITGAGAQTRIEPTSCKALAQSQVGPDASSAGSSSESAIVDLDGLHGITIKNLSLDGRVLTSVGCEKTSGYRAAVLVTDGASGNSLDGVTVTADTTYGIQMDGASQTQISGDSLEPAMCSATMKKPLPGLSSGWKYNQDLTLSNIPKCAAGFTHVMIAGISYSAKRSGSKIVVLTGGPTPPDTPAITSKSVVVFDTSVPSYTGVGIACNTLVQPLPAPTSCAINATTVIGGGTVYTAANSPVGILVTNDATAHLQDNKVSGNTDPEGDGIGIGLLPDTVDGETAGPTTIGDEPLGSQDGETLSGNDISILASAFPAVSSSAIWVMSGNTVSANQVGILLSGLTTGTNIGSVSVSSNNVINTNPGVGIELADVVGTGGGSVAVGGDQASLGNTVTGNGIGIVLTEGTTSANIQQNTIDDNVFFGVAVDGADAMPEFLPGLTSFGNTFTENTWTGNGIPVSGVVNGGANVIDFGGFSFPTGSIGGSVEAQANDLSLASPIPAGGVPSSITLVKASGFVEIGPGTLVSIDGYCAASTFTCNGTNVSFFVTSVENTPPTPESPTGSVGTTPVVVDVAPIAPGAAVPLNTVPSGTSVSTNDQMVLASSNVYSANSCTPIAPNTSTTLKAGTGGGPSGPEGSQTGYEAC